MDEDQWMYDNIMSEEVDMDDENEQECDVNEQLFTVGKCTGSHK